MNSFIETSLRNFCSNRDFFGESVDYVHFISKEKEDGINSGVIFGHIVYRTDKNEEKPSAPLMLKQIPSQHHFADYVLVQYFNEIFFYTRALPLLQQLGNLQPLQALLAEFYDSYLQSSPRKTDIVIIQQDLKAKGFRNYERFSFLDLQHLTLMLRGLGHFHSYSYMAKSQQPQQFNALGHWFKYAEAEVIRKRANYFRIFARIGLKRLRLDSGYSGHIGRLEKVLEDADALVVQMNTMEQEEPMSVLCHGDYLRGNVMFRYENGQPVDMKMIDMATCRIASPVMDLSLVLYVNADQQTRSRHWNHLIDAYYEGLCQPFGGVGVPSKDSILNEFTTKALYGYFIASHFLPHCIQRDQGIIRYYFNDPPAEYADVPVQELPEHIWKAMLDRWYRDEDAEALADILRDMVDRHFI